MNSKGYLTFLLHAHLPFVRHPEHEYFLEEEWYYEALSECYIPFLDLCNKLKKDKVRFRFTLSISPTLASMFADSLLSKRYSKKVASLLQLCEKEIIRFKDTPEIKSQAIEYKNKFLDIHNNYKDDAGLKIIESLKSLRDLGYLELITCSATHSFLPNIQNDISFVDKQISVAVETHVKYFDLPPTGMWLPECGYFPGLESVLAKNGIHYFFVDTHSIIYAKPLPKMGAFAPYSTSSGPYLFARDQESAKLVWSAKEGYPGNPNYKEFYCDIGFDREDEYIKPHIHPDFLFRNTGIKYKRITGSENKEIYNKEQALKSIKHDALHFINSRIKTIIKASKLMSRKPLITAPYDAELFGHWWAEGPEWLEEVCRVANDKSNYIKLVTPKEYLAEYPQNQIIAPIYSSWGEKGFSEVWLNDTNDWIYSHIHNAQDSLKDCIYIYINDSKLKIRILKQMLRELLLAQSSDWPFIIKGNTAVTYAKSRIKNHLIWFNDLKEELYKEQPSEILLKELEERHNLFPEISLDSFIID